MLGVGGPSQRQALVQPWRLGAGWPRQQVIVNLSYDALHASAYKYYNPARFILTDAVFRLLLLL